MDQQVYIWPIATGITDLPENWQDLAVPAITDIQQVWHQARQKLENTQQLIEFNSRLAREWAIETGVIEDIFHIDRGVTVTLIEQGLSAAVLEHGSVDKPADYVINILRDHVETLDWLLDRFVTQQRPLTVGTIKELHQLMTEHQAYVDAQDSLGHYFRAPLLKGDWKKLPNNVERDGSLYCYCAPEHVQSEMERLVELHAKHAQSNVSPEVQAAWIHHRFTQIHPFQDGNGRVARALATLVFLRAGLFPLVVSRDIKIRYIDSLEAADSGNLNPLVGILAEAQQQRFDKALNITEDLASPPKTIKLAIASLKHKLDSKAAIIAEQQRNVFNHARNLEKVAEYRLGEICELLEPIQAYVSRSEPANDFNYRGQIVAEARRLNYYANSTVYRSWVRMHISGQTPAQLLFSFHARGSEFAGVMVCTPIFELLSESQSDDAPRERTQIPLADKPFEFYFTEANDPLAERYTAWLDEVVALAISQYQRAL